VGIIIELLVELVLQLVIELLFEGGFRVVGRALSRPLVRAAVSVVCAVGVGFGLGWWWGDRLADAGRTAWPQSLWVSIGLAVVFTVAALAVGLRDTFRDPGEEPDTFGERIRLLFMPWRWPAFRLGGFALFNAAIATGIALGFDPATAGSAGLR